MNLLKTITMSSALLLATTGCTLDVEEKIIDQPDFKSEDGIFNIDALQALGRVSDPQISPDKTKILYGISYESAEENTSNRDLYVMDIDGNNNHRITKTPKSENNAVWFNGGDKYFGSGKHISL